MIFITPQVFTLTTTPQDINVSSYVSSSATGVIFRMYTVGTDEACNGYISKKGSSDSIYLSCTYNKGTTGIIGIDSNKKFTTEIYSDTLSDVRIEVLGYFEGDAVFPSFYDLSPSSGWNAYTDVDISSAVGSDTPTAGIFYVDNAYDPFGLRKNGTSYDKKQVNYQGSVFIVGVDSNKKIEAYFTSDDSGVNLILIGYIKGNGLVWNDTPTDKSIGTTGSWTDLSALPSDALGGIFNVHVTTTWDSGLDRYAGIRKNGTSHNPYMGMVGWTMQMVSDIDSSKIAEGKIANTDTDFYLVGYFKNPETTTNDSRSAKLTGTLGAYSERSASIKSDGIYDGRLAKLTGKSTSNSERSARVTDGTNRGNYGIKVTKPGYDVKTETDIKNMIFTSARGVLGLRRVREYTSTTDANGNIELTVYHNFGYVPIVIVKVETYDGKEVTINPTEWHSFYQTVDRELVEVTELFDFILTDTSFTMKVHAEAYNHDTWVGWNVSGRSYTFKVYYYFNEVTDQ